MNEKAKSNGHDKTVDEGLMALRRSFDAAKYTSIDARDAAILMMRGAHREQQIPDSVIMEVYASITAGKNIHLDMKTDDGHGYVACIESYADMIKFMQGELFAGVIEP